VVVAAALLAVACFPSGSSGSLSAHHDDPFLTCVRRVESGGNYQALSPGGTYRGAYQFLQATWDSTANHVGARDLVGVDPASASPTLQDDMAWNLYQWQGTGPWAGDGC
jgi:muramidase (phage lysozyme)